MTAFPRQVPSYADRMASYRRVLEARSLRTPAERLRQLSRDPVRPVRLWTARNAAAPTDALAVLLRDADYWVQWNALLHRATPGSALEQLTRDSEAWGRLRRQTLVTMIVHHPNTPAVLRDELRRNGACRCPDSCAGQAAYTRRETHGH